MFSRAARCCRNLACRCRIWLVDFLRKRSGHWLRVDRYLFSVICGVAANLALTKAPDKEVTLMPIQLVSPRFIASILFILITQTTWLSASESDKKQNEVQDEIS